MRYLTSLIALALTLAAPLARAAIEPIQGNSGKYLSPYTSDGVVAEWVDKSINASMGSSVGSAVGAAAGAKAMENVPLIGGFLGSKVGEAVGRKTAVEASGGEEYMRETSDLSFNSLKKMAAWMHSEHGDSRNFQEVLEATQEVYPELEHAYPQAVAEMRNNGTVSSTRVVRAGNGGGGMTSTPAADYVDRQGHGGIALVTSSGDFEGTGLDLDYGAVGGDAGEVGLFADVGFLLASDENLEINDFHVALGPSYGFNSRVRGYAGLGLDLITYYPESSWESLDFTGLGYRLGAEFSVPQQNLIFDLGVRSVDADTEDDFGNPVYLDYTGIKASVEVGLSKGAGLWLGYEDREDYSHVLFGFRGRFSM